MKTQQPVQISIEVPPDLDAVYANLALITYSASEVILDFARVLPNVPRAKVHTRIITTPLNAKLLLQALNNSLDHYETQFGEIKTPSKGDELAQQFFGAIRPPQSPTT